MRLENFDSLQTSQNALHKTSGHISDIKSIINRKELRPTQKHYIKRTLINPLNIIASALNDLGVLAVRVAKVFQGIIKLFYDPKKGVKLIALNTTLIMTGLVRLTIMTPLSKTILTLSDMVGIASPKTALQISLASYKLDQATHYVEAKIKGLFEESSHIEEENEVEEEVPISLVTGATHEETEAPISPVIRTAYQSEEIPSFPVSSDDENVSPSSSAASQAETVILEDNDETRMEKLFQNIQQTTELSKQLEKVEQEIAKVKKDIQLYQGFLAKQQKRAEQGHTSGKRKVQGHTETIARLEDQLQTAENKRDDLKVRYAEFKAQHANLEAAVLPESSATLATLKSVEQEIAIEKEKVERFQGHLAKQQKRAEQGRTSGKRKVQGHTETIAQSKARLTPLEAQRDDLKVRYAEIEAQRAEIESRIQAFEAQLAEV